MRPATQPETLCLNSPEVETVPPGVLEPHLAGATILHAHIRNGRLRCIGFRRNLSSESDTRP